METVSSISPLDSFFRQRKTIIFGSEDRAILGSLSFIRSLTNGSVVV